MSDVCGSRAPQKKNKKDRAAWSDRLRRRTRRRAIELVLVARIPLDDPSRGPSIRPTGNANVRALLAHAHSHATCCVSVAISARLECGSGGPPRPAQQCSSSAPPFPCSCSAPRRRARPPLWRAGGGSRAEPSPRSSSFCRPCSTSRRLCACERRADCRSQAAPSIVPKSTVAILAQERAVAHRLRPASVGIRPPDLGSRLTESSGVRGRVSADGAHPSLPRSGAMPLTSKDLEALQGLMAAQLSPIPTGLPSLQDSVGAHFQAVNQQLTTLTQEQEPLAREQRQRAQEAEAKFARLRRVGLPSARLHTCAHGSGWHGRLRGAIAARVRVAVGAALVAARPRQTVADTAAAVRPRSAASRWRRLWRPAGGGVAPHRAPKAWRTARRHGAIRCAIGSATFKGCRRNSQGALRS